MAGMGWVFVLFGALHLLLGLGLFGFVAWLMHTQDEDDVEDGSGGGDGGSRLTPRPRRPGPGRPRRRRGPVRAPAGGRGPALRPTRQPA